ncbi:unnamed protein product [Linum trigynum]|uniref:Peptidase A2 domain-containing protein n=1 Tax=Linum trigynum TaxID=586398 RepID=A0AAV2DN28_9ROSI
MEFLKLCLSLVCLSLAGSSISDVYLNHFPAVKLRHPFGQAVIPPPKLEARSPHATLRFRANINRTKVVTVLVDSGANINLINERLAVDLQLKATPLVQPLRLGTVNGEQLACRTKYTAVVMDIQGLEVSVTLYALPIAGDVILGIQWLEELGPVICDWKLRTMRFTLKNKERFLRGIP